MNLFLYDNGSVMKELNTNLNSENLVFTALLRRVIN